MYMFWRWFFSKLPSIPQPCLVSTAANAKWSATAREYQETREVDNCEKKVLARKLEICFSQVILYVMIALWVSSQSYWSSLSLDPDWERLHCLACTKSVQSCCWCEDFVHYSNTLTRQLNSTANCIWQGSATCNAAALCLAQLFWLFLTLRASLIGHSPFHIQERRSSKFCKSRWLNLMRAACSLLRVSTCCHYFSLH